MLVSKFVKLWCQFWNGISVSLQILYHSSLPWYITDTYTAHTFSTWDKRIPSKSQFETFECSRKNLPNSSCHLPNHNPPGKCMLVEYLWNIPMRYSQCIRKNVPMKFRGIFRNNVSGILNTGIFPDCSMDILRMLHAFF